MVDFQLCERGVWGKFPEGRLYERKLDGTRALAIKLEDKVKLINRRGVEYTEQFPEIVADLRTYPHHALILDGEICDRDCRALSPVVFESQGGRDFDQIPAARTIVR